MVKTWRPSRDLDCTSNNLGRAGKNAYVNIHAHARASQICLQNIGGQDPNCPMVDGIFKHKFDPIFGSKSGPQNGVQNWIAFLLLPLSLCLGPVLGSRFGPKNGVRFEPKNAVSQWTVWLLPADVLQADLRCMSMSVKVSICFFPLRVPSCCLYCTIYNAQFK